MALHSGGCTRTIGIIESGTCPSRFHFYQLGARHTGTVYNRPTGYACTPVEHTGDLYQLSGEIDPSTLVELKRTIQ
jgi:hypothetical protein